MRIRPSSATDSANGITYATGWSTPPSNTNCAATAVCYTPQGSPYALNLDETSGFTGMNVLESYTSRLQPNEIKVTAPQTWGTGMDISYNFVDPVSGHNAGVVYGITNNLNSSRTQTFTYDQLNRILSAGTSATTGTYCWGYQFSYDTYGNLLSQAGASGYGSCTESTMSVTADGNNHLSGLSYDNAGNTLNDGNYSYTYDGESQLKTAGGVTYAYDGDGRRAAKVGSKLYWYGTGGEILAETDAAGNVQNEYVFFGGKRVALVPASGDKLFYIEDLLGSSRLVAKASAVCYDGDFTPFGGEKAYTNTCAQNYKFEGKERDTETQNDDFGAREFTWRFGRWLSSDWSSTPVAVPYANLTNPQTLNLYAMVEDDPESFADLDGHEEGGGGGGDAGGQVPSQTTDKIAPPPTQLSQQVKAQNAAGPQGTTAQQQNGTAAQGAGQAGGQQGLQNQQLKYKTVSGGQGTAWEVDLSLTHNTTIGGFIVQHIVADFAGAGHYDYWEAWPVSANSHVPSIHGTDANGSSYSDLFAGGAGSHIHASARFYEGLTLPSSFKVQPAGFPAGILKATTTNPNLPTQNATAPMVRWWHD
jgi:RHS repeat-associated protein